MSPRNSANGSNIIFYNKIIILDHPQTFGPKSVQQMFKNLESRSVNQKIVINKVYLLYL